MALSTTVHVEHPDVPLVSTIRALPDADVGVVSTAGTDPDHDVHCFWVETDDFEAFEATLASDHTVESFSALAGGDGRRTYHIGYSDEATLVTPVVTDAGGLVLDSRSSATGWELTLQLQDRGALDALDEFTDREGVRLEVREIRETDENGIDTDFGLTEAQIEGLVNAYRNGHYDEPRQASLADLSELLGISETAVSGRIRRGSAALIEETLVDED